MANACLIRIWVELFAYSAWPAARDYGPPSGGEFLSAMLLCVALGHTFWLVNRWGGRRVLTLAAMLLFTKECFLATSGLGWFPRGAFLRFLPLLALAAVAAAAVAALWLPRGAPRAADALVPLLLLTFGHAAFHVGDPPPQPGFSYRPPGKAAASPRRVVWIVFDELDERIAFSQRKHEIPLPGFDRFRAAADFVAREARSPANSTDYSVAELLRGNPFQQLSRQGFRVAVAGWALPYCVTYADAGLAACEWFPMARQHNSYGDPAIWGQAVSLLESNHLSPFGQTRSVRRHAWQAEAITQSAARMASDASLDFVYLHLPHTHNPFVWDPATRTPTRPARPPDPEGYLRNLQWADEAFARIRAAMEISGVWDRSIVLVTADHGYREGQLLGYPKEDLHVPWMLKGKWKDAPSDPGAPLRTAITASVLTSLLLGN